MSRMSPDVAVLLLTCFLVTDTTSRSVSQGFYHNQEENLVNNSAGHGIKKRAVSDFQLIAEAVPIAPHFSAIFESGPFTYGILDHDQQLEELKTTIKKLDKLLESLDELGAKVKPLEMIRHQWIPIAPLYNNVQRLRFLLQQMKTKVAYCKCKSAGNLVIKSPRAAKDWADAVLDTGSEGLQQVMFLLHDLVMGTGHLFGKRSLVSIYKDHLATPSDTNPGTFTQDMEDFIQYLMVLESGGYAAITTAMNIKGKSQSDISAFIGNRAKPRMNDQWLKISETVGRPSPWREVSSFVPPFHIAADGHRDLGARFVDLNGDGKIDIVFHRWINGHRQQKGAYLNNGNGWTSTPQYTPPFHIAADGHSDLGARFVDLNGDGKIDMVFHRWINGQNQQKGAYLNNGNGWTSTPQYTPPFHIAADRHGDLGARFVDLNGDGKIDMIYHRWINGQSQQKGAYVNHIFGNFTEPFAYESSGEVETCDKDLVQSCSPPKLNSNVAIITN